MTISPETLSLLDDAVRIDLQALRDKYFFWLLVSTAVVAIGVILEGPEVVNDIAEEFSGFHAGKRCKRWIASLSSIGWLLIVAGVGGEGVLESLVGRADLLLQIFENAVLTQTQLGTAAANERAANANKEAGLARLETADLLKVVSPRDLDEERQHKILIALHDFGGETVFIRSYPGDGEAARLIMEIKSALEPTIHVEDRTGELIGQMAPSGFVFGIQIDASRDKRVFAQALVSAFSREGQLSVQSLSPFGSVEMPTDIKVGIKPPIIGGPLRRVLDASEEKRLKGVVASYNGRSIDLVTYPSDPEIGDLRNQLSRIFDSAGWHVHRFETTESGYEVSGSNSFSKMLDPVAGILVSTSPRDPTASKVAQEIIEALPKRFEIHGPVTPHRFINGYNSNDKDLINKPIRLTIGRLR